MSPVTLISGIIILLAALVCYAFAAQTLQVRRERRKRLLAALKHQLRNFKFVISGCPEGFLTRELKLLVLRSLIEVSEQLCQLEPNVATHTQDLELYNEELAKTQRQTSAGPGMQLQTLQQSKEAKMSLEELYRHVVSQAGMGRISATHAELYKTQIKQLALQVTADAYSLNGQIALQQDKPKLALHYFDLALKLLRRESKPGLFEQKIVALVERCTQLRELLMTRQDRENDEEEQLLEEQWEKFAADDSSDLWRKKQIYD